MLFYINIVTKEHHILVICSALPTSHEMGHHLGYSLINSNMSWHYHRLCYTLLLSTDCHTSDFLSLVSTERHTSNFLSLVSTDRHTSNFLSLLPTYRHISHFLALVSTDRYSGDFLLWLPTDRHTGDLLGPVRQPWPLGASWRHQEEEGPPWTSVRHHGVVCRHMSQ